MSDKYLGHSGRKVSLKVRRFLFQPASWAVGNDPLNGEVKITNNRVFDRNQLGSNWGLVLCAAALTGEVAELWPGTSSLNTEAKMQTCLSLDSVAFISILLAFDCFRSSCETFFYPY